MTLAAPWSCSGSQSKVMRRGALAVPVWALVCMISWLTKTADITATEIPGLSDIRVEKVGQALSEVAGVRQEFVRLLAGLVI